MNIDWTRLLERLLACAVGDSARAEAILGDLEEERPRWRALHVLRLAARFAVRRPPRLVAVPRSRPMTTLFQDVRYGVRTLLRQPGFSLIVVVTLAIGLGANAAVFAIVDGLLLRPLPAAQVDGLVQVYTTNAAQGSDREGVSPAIFLDWQEQAQSFERLLALAWWDASLSDDAQDPEKVVARRVSAAFFEDLRVALARGRGFAPEEEVAGRDRVAVIGHRLWQRRWGGAASLVGSTITIDRQPFVVVGIAPAGFDYPAGTEIWAPITFTEESRRDRGRRHLDVIGRLKPGVDVESAQQDMAAIAARLAKAYPDTDSGYGVQVLTMSYAMLDLGLPAVLAIWQFAVALVLLIACANVANLLLVRGAARRRDLALRLAIGASRWRVVRQLLVESVILAIVGVALAMPIAWGGVGLIKSFMPPEIARWILGWSQVDVDGRLLGVTMLAGVAAGALFGTLPALRASRPELVGMLKEGARGGGVRSRALRGFVVAQIALALALLVSAGLSTRGAVRLLTQHDGYDPDGVMTFALTLPREEYPSDQARLQFYEKVLAQVRALPQVEHASVSNTVPFGDGNSRRTVEVEGQAVSNAAERPDVDFRAVTPEYFDVMHVPLTRGRAFTDGDRAGLPQVAIVDRAMAQRLWPDADPLGRRFRSTHQPGLPWLTVVGVASNVKHHWFDGYRPTFYVPYAQSTLAYGVLSVRTRGDETAVAPAVREVLRGLDRNLPVSDVHSLRRWRSLRTIGMQFVAGLMASFAGIGLFLAAIGIYGVMAYSVSQRTREIGVRIALGATAGDVMGMTLRDTMLLSGVGIAVGLVVAFGLGKLLVANLFGVVQLDAATFVAVAAGLAVVAVVAGSVPARRAMRVDPISALRVE